MSRQSRIFISLRGSPVLLPFDDEPEVSEAALTGILTATAVGNVAFTKSGSLALTGIASATQVGTILQEVSLAVSGVASTSEEGIVDNIHSIAVTGNASAAVVGTVTVPASTLNNVRISVMYFQQMYAPIAMGD